MDILEKVPRWALVAITAVSLFVACGLGGAVGVWAKGELDGAISTNTQQDKTLANHEWRLTATESNYATINTKLDKLLESRGANK